MDTSKVIRGVVNSGKYTVTAPIVKEDYGLYLKIEGVELPPTYQVDFSNSESNGTSVTMIGNADGVLIPSQFISTGKDVFAFLYHVGADYGRTVYKFRIPNKVRPDRTDEEPTPEEQSVIDQTISALNEAVAQTAQDVASADQSAQSAQEYAEQAETARNTAQTYANNAQTSANNASASAQASANSATASANSATTAQGFAQSASASASSASGYASSAQTSANTASAKAQDASTSAQTASQKATESAQSASQAQGYANTAEQAKTASQTAQGLAESARDSAISARDEAESARDEAVQAVASISGALDNKADVITDTASGSIASFSDGADNLPLKSLVVDINPVQDLHGQDAPYPAGGGKNLLGSKESKTFNPSASSSFAFEKDSSQVTFTTSGLSTALGYRFNDIDLKCTLPAGTYYFSSNISNQTAGSGLFVFNVDTSAILARARLEGGGQFTLSEAATIRLGANLSATTVSGTYWFQLESGSAATAYAPYENICPISGWTEVNVNHSDADTTNPTTITINLGQTVYGGKLDVLSGELTVYPYYASYNGETLTGEWISDRDKYVSGTTPTIGAQVVNIGAQGVTVQLSANQINSLYGANNIWAVSGDTEVVYRADTKAYIAKKIAEALASLT